MMYERIKGYLVFLILLIVDILTILISLKIALFIRVNFIPAFIIPPDFNQRLIDYMWFLPVFIIVFIQEGLYIRRLSLWDEIKIEIKSILISLFLILFILFASKKSVSFSRTLIMTHSIVLIILMPLVRMLTKRFLFNIKLFVRRVLIVGSGRKAEDVIKAIENDKNPGYEIIGLIDDYIKPDKKRIYNYKIHKGIGKIERYINYSKVLDVIIAKDEMDDRELSELVNKLQHKVQNTILVPDIKGIAVFQTEIRYFFNEQIIALEIKNNLSNPVIYFTKRIIDYLLAVLIFIFILPIMIIIAIAIKISDKGPVLYCQKRIGKNGRPFKCYKFRTMYVDAEKKLKELLENNPELKAEYQKYWKIKNDPRITPIGNLLRKTSIDELPQILNVLKGEMSLVGPRPYLPKEWSFIEKESPIIHALPPGITGLWQVSGRSNTSYEYRISLDSWYVKNWNLWLDIVILLKTFSAVLKREGAC